MKNVYVATYFDWFSFGAVLQSIAMNHFLDQMGYKGYLIDYQHQDLNKKNVKNFKQIIHKMLFALDDYKRKKHTIEFLKKNVRFTKHYTNFEQLEELNDSHSNFLVGSDQVWHPDLCSDFFFLRFVPQCKRNSYAASMGKVEIDEEQKDKFEKYVNEFSCISVREKSVEKCLKNIVDKRIEVNVDPTFLQTQKFWEKREKEYKIKKPYVLVFPIYWDEKYNQVLKKYHKETGIDIVAFTKSPRVYCNHRINDADPGQFLFLIHHAENVISSSFHGIVFSMIYKKDFRAFINPRLPSRITDLLEMFGLGYCGEEVKKLEFPKVDYTLYDKVISKEKLKAQAYLREALGND